MERNTDYLLIPVGSEIYTEVMASVERLAKLYFRLADEAQGAMHDFFAKAAMDTREVSRKLYRCPIITIGDHEMQDDPVTVAYHDHPQAQVW